MAGRTVLVTGASGGIGRAAALGLARMGADLAICGRDPASTKDATGELSAAGGGPVEVFAAGLSAQLEVRRLAGEALQRLPRTEVRAADHLVPTLRSRSLPGSSPAGAVGLAGVPGDQDALIADGQQAGEWGGWGSNPRPADYEKYGLLQPVR